jgi:branched-subunit amino acid ABC-type transport system permease component
VSVFLGAIGFGIASGAVIAIGALGFTMQFGLSNILNVAYGAFLTLAAFVGYAFVGLGMNPWLAMLLASLATGIGSVGFYQILVRGLTRRGASVASLVIATFAAGIVLEYAIVSVVGPQVVSYGVSPGATIRIGAITWSTMQLAVIVLSAALMLALHLVLTQTTLGRAIRATAVNRTLARSCGIRTERVTQLTWFLSGFLCGVAAVALALTTESFDFTFGATFLIVIIAAAVVGGIGQPYGAMLGGLLIGLTTEVSAAYLSPAYRDVIAFLLLIAMLLFRPTGILGTQTRRQSVAGSVEG